jgi:hypothetical protein
MLGALLLAAAVPATAIEAERAFAADAQTLGQWTAFRKWAADGAIFFVPQPVKVHEFLKSAADPKLTYQWWPAKAYLSCDGHTAVTTGPAVRGGYRGYFTTVWQRQPSGEWRWLLDHGAALERPRRAMERTQVRRAACGGPDPRIVRGDDGASPQTGHGQSADSRLHWAWFVNPGNGARSVSVQLWTGRHWERVLIDDVGPAAS